MNLQGGYLLRGNQLAIRHLPIVKETPESDKKNQEQPYFFKENDKIKEGNWSWSKSFSWMVIKSETIQALISLK
jgi:hypothetical protein